MEALQSETATATPAPVARKTPRHKRKACPLPKSRRAWGRWVVYNLRRQQLRGTVSGFVERVILDYLVHEYHVDRERAKVLSVGLTYYVNHVMGVLRNHTPTYIRYYRVRKTNTRVARRVIVDQSGKSMVLAVSPGLASTTPHMAQFTSTVLEYLHMYMSDQKAETATKLAAKAAQKQ